MPDQPFSPLNQETESSGPSPEAARPPETPEARREAAPERPREEAPAPAPEAGKPAPPPSPVAPPEPVGAAPRDETARRVEGILEENMMGLYMIMPPEVQRAFKAKGEETARKIRALLGATKVKAKEILKLIRDWLKLIPGVNRFFLEQEAKIKTDKIMNLKNRE